MRDAAMHCLWALAADVGAAVDLGLGAAQHPVLLAAGLAFINFWAGYGMAAARVGTTEGECPSPTRGEGCSETPPP